jgi:hypothetical protein
MRRRISAWSCSDLFIGIGAADTRTPLHKTVVKNVVFVVLSPDQTKLALSSYGGVSLKSFP